jgi:hypothetical protein
MTSRHQPVYTVGLYYIYFYLNFDFILRAACPKICDFHSNCLKFWGDIEFQPLMLRKRFDNASLKKKPEKVQSINFMI